MNHERALITGISHIHRGTGFCVANKTHDYTFISVPHCCRKHEPFVSFSNNQKIRKNNFKNFGQNVILSLVIFHFNSYFVQRFMNQMGSLAILCKVFVCIFTIDNKKKSSATSNFSKKKNTKFNYWFHQQKSIHWKLRDSHIRIYTIKILPSN